MFIVVVLNLRITDRGAESEGGLEGERILGRRQQVRITLNKEVRLF